MGNLAAVWMLAAAIRPESRIQWQGDKSTPVRHSSFMIYKLYWPVLWHGEEQTLCQQHEQDMSLIGHYILTVLVLRGEVR